MRNRFDRRLSEISDELVVMGAQCEDAVSYSMRAFFDRDLDMASKALETEKKIDQKEKDIETLCMRILLQEQPVASDLRKVSSALKMISDMERIGDQAEDISEIVFHMEDSKEKLDDIDIGPMEDMWKASLTMVTESVNAFVEGDIELAKKVIKADDEVDDFFKQIRKQLIAQLAVSREDEVIGSADEKGMGEVCFDIFMIAKYLERVGDHATNIAEWVIYGLTGKHPDPTVALDDE